MGRLGLLVSSCVISFLIGEIIVRSYMDPGIDTWGPEVFCRNSVGTIMKPNRTNYALHMDWGAVQITANSMGYRDVEWSQKSEGRRVMLLGDSFAWGWGCRYEKSIPSLLDNSDRLAVYNLYNLSMPSDGLDSYYRRYRAHRKAVDPELVLLIIYINDFYFQDWKVDFHDVRSPIATYVPACEDSDIRDADRNGDGRPEILNSTLRLLINRSYVFRLANRIRLQGGIRVGGERGRREWLKVAYKQDITTVRLTIHGRAATDCSSMA